MILLSSDSAASIHGILVLIVHSFSRKGFLLLYTAHLTCLLQYVQACDVTDTRNEGATVR
jgi:hypothetical protein